MWKKNAWKPYGIFSSPSPASIYAIAYLEMRTHYRPVTPVRAYVRMFNHWTILNQFGRVVRFGSLCLWPWHPQFHFCPFLLIWYKTIVFSLGNGGSIPASVFLFWALQRKTLQILLCNNFADVLKIAKVRSFCTVFLHIYVTHIKKGSWLSRSYVLPPHLSH